MGGNLKRQAILVEDQPGLRLSVAGIPDQIRSWLRERDQRIVEVIPLAIMTPKNNPLLSRDTDPPVTAAENPSLSTRVPRFSGVFPQNLALYQRWGK